MRTLSTQASDILESKKFAVHLRVEVENSTGGFVNLSNLSTADWVKGARWDWSLDQPVAELTVQLRRDHGRSTGQSLSPLDADSTFNYNSTSGFSALVKPGRELNVYTAETTVGGPAPASSAMDWVFQGEIDDVAWPNSPIDVVARSKNMGRLFDRWIMSSTYAYGNSSGVAIETVMEQILANWTDLSTTVLWTPVSPGFLIAPAYKPDKQSVLDAITTLSQLIGWNVLEAYSTASSGWRLKFSEPTRTVTSSGKVWTFGADQYFAVNDMAMSRRDVRNYIPVLYGGSTSRTSLIVQSTSSQDEYGLRYMEFEESINSPIATSSEAYNLGFAAVTDLKEPPATHEIELPYWWPGELNDFYEFTPNGIHYSSAQYLACYGITHDLRGGTGRTLVRTRGRPAGHYLQWLNYRSGGNLVFAEVLGVEISHNLDGVAVVAVSAKESITKTIYITVGNGTTPADPTAAANHGSLSGFQGIITSTVTITPGFDTIIKAVAADAAGILGPVITAQLRRQQGLWTLDGDDHTLGSYSVRLFSSEWANGGSVVFEGSAYASWTTSTGSHGQVYIQTSTGTWLQFSSHVFATPTTQWNFSVRLAPGPTSSSIRATYQSFFYPAGVAPLYTGQVFSEQRQASVGSTTTFDFFVVSNTTASTSNNLVLDWSRGTITNG